MDVDLRVALVVNRAGVDAAKIIGDGGVVVRRRRGGGGARGRHQEAERVGRARLHESSELFVSTADFGLG